MLPTVPVPPKSIDEYAEAAGEAAVERLRAAAEPLRGARLLHVNSTAFGGGVAELLLTHVALLNDLGIETVWAVLEGSDEFFAVTKAMHNALQGAEVPWDPGMEAAYLERIAANAKELDEPFDLVLVHDPQPAALLEAIEDGGRRQGAWAWRCHLDLSAPFEPVWDFVSRIVGRYDGAVFTSEGYVQAGFSGPRIAFIPPSIDPLSTKNCPVNVETRHEVLLRYGVDNRRPILTQVSRFDPWKDPLGVIDAYRLVKEEMPDLQLVMIGSMAHDDPEGMRYLDLTAERAAGDPDIHMLTNFEGVSNLEVNAFQRASTVVVQKSLREGFGLVVAEAMWKEKPVVGGDVGGIRLQIDEGRSGFLVGSAEECAGRVLELLRDADLRARMGREARELVRERFLSLRELEDHLRFLASLR